MALDAYRFERARVAISEPSPVFASALRSVLHGMGFRNFTVLNGMSALREEFDATAFDLWVTNAELRDGTVFELIHDLRHGKVGKDIFLPIIVQNAEVTRTLAQRVLDAGADLLWRLPLTGGQIVRGLDILLHHRRPFVVTADYIGPDRRTAARSEIEPVPLINAPNPLRARTCSELPAVDHISVLQKINQRKVEAQASLIASLVARIISLLESDPKSPEATQYLERLRAAAGDLMCRVVLTKYLHQAELCRALVVQARKLLHKTDPTQLAILRELDRALRAAFHTIADDEAQAALEIAQQVQKLPWP